MKLIQVDFRTANITDINNIIDEYGYIILTNVLTSDHLKSLRNELEPEFQARDNSQALFFGFNTKRIEGLFTKSKTVQDMAVNPTIINLVKHILEPNCDKIQINLTQGIRINPGEKKQILHPDSAMYPIEPKPFEFTVNALWAYTDFTKNNGATHIVPGSHKWEASRQPDNHEIISAEMNAGSVLLYQASLLHGGGSNISTQPRTGIAISYCLGWLRQSENQYLTYSPEDVRSFSQDLQELIGYDVHRPNLGWVYGQSPQNILYPEKKSKCGAEDFLTDDQKILLKEYHSNEAHCLTSHNHKVA